MKDFMKDKMLIFIIGLLVGAIIATGCYFCYAKSHQGKKQMGDKPQMMMQQGNHTGMPSGTPPQMPSSDGNNTQGQTPDGNAPSGIPQAPTTSNTSESTNSNS